MDNGIHNLVPIPSILDNPFDGPIDAQKVLHFPDVLRLLDHVVVLHGKLQRLLETLVLLLRHQETQTEIGEPGGDSFAHLIINLLELLEPQTARHQPHRWFVRLG
jgi:hypothetical protein